MSNTKFTKIENVLQLVAFGLMEDRTPVIASPSIYAKNLRQLQRADGQRGPLPAYCNVCGTCTMDVNSPLQHDNEADAPYIPKASLYIMYKRRQYYLEKI